jgi:hypothetical protein
MTIADAASYPQVAMLVAQATTRQNPDTFATAIRERLPDGALVECPACDRVGLPERIVVHNC